MKKAHVPLLVWQIYFFIHGTGDGLDLSKELEEICLKKSKEFFETLNLFKEIHDDDIKALWAKAEAIIWKSIFKSEAV